MRTVLLIATAMLIAGCSHATVSEPEQTATTAAGPGSAKPSPARTSPTGQPRPAAPPPDGAPINEVIGWIEAGRPADPAGYHSATSHGETTELDDDIAFTTAGAAGRGASCITDTGHAGGALSCLVNLTDPPPRPDDVYGEWKGNWVDFTGTTVQVGSAHGDPGPFGNGDGAELPDGASLSFGDYRCRADRAGLFCVNYAHRSAVRLAAAGVAPFGCLAPVVPAPEGVGKLFSC